MYIELFGSSDRLGGNIADMISQLLFAVKNNLFIKYDRNFIRVYNSYNQNYNKSIFMQTIFDIIDKHNSKLDGQNLGEFVNLAEPSHFQVLSKTTLSLEQDLFTFFRKNLFDEEQKKSFGNKAKQLGYEIPFNPKKTILVHHRLEDVRHRVDYDGTPCVEFMSNLINQRIVPNNNILNLKEPNPECHSQCPISNQKIITQIEKIREYKPNHEVIIISSPNENLEGLPYRYLSSNDEFYDLFLMCNSETTILSRSNYALSSIFFGIANDVNIPLWGHLPCYGLKTIFDNSNFKYFV